MSNEKKGPVTEMAERSAGLEKDAARLRDEYVRALADFDNFRKRVERDLAVTQRLVLEGFMKDLLPVLDNFERAMLTLGDTANGDSVRKGIDLIYRQLCETLEKHGVKQYSCVGQAFDPKRAEAISFAETDEHEPNVVVQEACRGYECEGRVVRPARVVVAKPKPKAAESDITAAGSGDRKAVEEPECPETRTPEC